MRNSLLLSSILCASVSFAAQLTPGNILVLQAGSSLVPYANGSWNEGTILEFSPTGTLVQTIPLPAGMAIHPDTKLNFVRNRICFSGAFKNPVTAINFDCHPITGTAQYAITMDLNGAFGAHHAAYSPVFTTGFAYSGVVLNNEAWLLGRIEGATRLVYVAPDGKQTRTGDLTGGDFLSVADGELYTEGQVGFGKITNSTGGLPREAGSIWTQTFNPQTFGHGGILYSYGGNRMYTVRPSATETGVRSYSESSGSFVYNHRMNEGGFDGVSVGHSGNFVAVTTNDREVWAGTDNGVGSALTKIYTAFSQRELISVAVIPANTPGSAPLTGTVNFGPQYSGSLRGWNTVPVTFEVIKNGNLRQRVTLNLAPSGGVAPYSLPLESGLSGTVTINMSAPTWLKASRTLNLAGSENFTLVNGDCNSDNVVDLTDYTVVAIGFNTLFGDSAFNLTADLDKNGVVDLTDYTIVATNFNSIGS